MTLNEDLPSNRPRRRRRAPRRPPPQDLAGFIERIGRSEKLGRDVVQVEEVAAREAAYGTLADPLPQPLAAALLDVGIERLYAHQAEAIDRYRAGGDVLIVTPTASGKSLVYLVPTIEAALLRPGSRALYLFPYKALAQDQLQGFEELSAATARHGGVVPGAGGLLGGGRPVSAAIYDGDTPDSRRRRIKADPPDVLITNPDMLHLGILAHHDDWRPFFENLDCVVIDELHVYRGIFGSHLYQIIKRLQRIAAQYSRRPRFIASSATIANPGALGESLLGRPFAVVDRHGAPLSAKRLMFLNPRSSPYTAATLLFSWAMDAGFRVIAFTRARTVTELMHSWLLQTAPRHRDRISCYRSGYLPEERREIERQLFAGELQGVISTSALELGVDIGGLDVCLLVGYPGSIVSSWQRIGRVGREDRPSLTVLIAMPDALDQYFMANPREFMTRGFEEVVFDPHNPVIARAHFLCASAEKPLDDLGDRALYGEEIFPLVDELCRDGLLARHAEERRWFTLRRRPQRDVSLRSSGNTYAIADERTDRVIGTIDSVRAFHETHTGAIYLHHGQQYLVRELDIESRRVRVTPVQVEYYTEVRGEKETEIMETLEEISEGPVRASLGRLKVTEQITGYEKRRIMGRDRLGLFELSLPPLTFETVGLWITVPDPLRDAVLEAEGHFMGGIHAAEHAMISLFPLLAICDRSDVGGISYTHHPQISGAAVFIYDGHPGGVGLAAKGFRSLGDLIGRTARLLSSCPCDGGCPSCIQSPKCSNGNNPLDKEAALMILETLGGLRPMPAAATMVKGAASVIIKKGASDSATRRGATNATAKRGAATTAATTTTTMRREVTTSTEKWGVPESAPRSGRRSRGGARERPSPARQTLFFDLETQRSAEEVGGWQNLAEMRLALAVTYNDVSGRFKIYREENVERLLLDLVMADRVVGYNIDRFDLPVLAAYTEWDLSRIRTCDMLGDIYRKLGFRLKLADVAEATLGITKTADGLQSLRWWKEGRLDLIEEYCRRDVELTRDVYLFGRDNGYVLYRDRDGNPLRLPVDWT